MRKGSTKYLHKDPGLTHKMAKKDITSWNWIPIIATKSYKLPQDHVAWAILQFIGIPVPLQGKFGTLSRLPWLTSVQAPKH